MNLIKTIFIRGAVILALIVFCALSFSHPSESWTGQSCRSAHRIPVTITAGPAGHSDETRIDIVSANFPTSYTFSPAGDDIRVFASDDTTPVDFIVTGWNGAARTATIYVRRPMLAANASETLYIYFGDNALASTGDATSVFPTSGIRLRSRVTTVDPTDAATALAAFSGATVDVYNAIRTSITGLNNRALGGTNGDFAWCISAVLEVTPATAGSWGFRYGADFGRGGHLYMRETQLEAQWNDDLWWAGNFANTAETLEGTITLPPGWHRYEALGFEGCCDGTVGWQARAPGGAWQNFTTANFPLRAAHCAITTATVSFGAPESCGTALNASKNVTIISDITGSANPFSLPGSIMRYDIDVSNPGQEVDASTLVLTDMLPGEIDLVVAGPGAFTFTDGPIPSGLGFTFLGPSSTTDSVEFSTDGVDFTYIPTPSGGNQTDAAVTHIRFRPTGTFNAYAASNTPSFIISLLAEIK